MRVTMGRHVEFELSSCLFVRMPFLGAVYVGSDVGEAGLSEPSTASRAVRRVPRDCKEQRSPSSEHGNGSSLPVNKS